MLALTGTKFDYVHVDLMKGAQKQPDYLKKNPFGVVPTLVSNATGQVYCQSAAILEHLAHASGKFQGQTAEEQHSAKEWVFWGWDRLARGVYRTRAVKFGFMKLPADVADHYKTEAINGLKFLDDRLASHKWVAGGGQPTYADIDLYGVVHYAPQGGIALSEYPHVAAWATKIEALPHFAQPEALMTKG
jgi:glutathione S-transferase